MKPLRAFGIPVHPALVHFPVAGWTATTLLALAAVTFEPSVADMARYCNVAGLAGGILAMIAGFQELAVLPNDAAVRDETARHMLLASGSWALYLAMLLLQWKGLLEAAALTGIVAFVVLALAGHAGARLVYHHRLPSPPPEQRHV